MVEGELEQLTSDPQLKLYPAIHGDIVVFTDWAGGTEDVVYIDLTTGERGAITEDDKSNRFHHISGTRITYSQFPLLHPDIWVHDLATGEDVRVTDAEGAQGRSRIHGDWVVYEHMAETFEDTRVWATDLATGTVVDASGKPALDRRPGVHDQRVAFERYNGATSAATIMLHDLSDGSTRVAAAEEGTDQRQPDLDGDLLVYDAVAPDADERDVYVHHIDTGITEHIDLPGDQTRARVSGDVVAFRYSTSLRNRSCLASSGPGVHSSAARARW